MIADIEGGMGPMGGRSCGSCLYRGQALAYGTLTHPNLQKPLRCSRSASPLNMRSFCPQHWTTQDVG